MGKWTVEQLESALEEIGTTANTLADFARDAMQGAGKSAAASELHIVAMLAERMGSLADYMVGGGIVGDQGDWVLGPNFHRSEVAHG